MSWARRHPLWFIGGAGVVIRLVFAFAFYGSGDLFTFEVVAERAVQDPLHSYGGNLDSAVGWFYPPMYLLWLVSSRKLAAYTGLPFHGTVQLLPILADLAIAVAIYVYLGWRNAGERDSC